MAFDPAQFLTFFQWLLPGQHGLGAILTCVLVVPAVAVILGLAGYLVAALRHGPVEGFYAVAQTTVAGITDAIGISPRRVLAIARLAIQESVRRWVLVVFAIFIVVLLFAGWFLDVRNDDPARLYLSFVLTMTTYLMWALALFLSTFSLPNDIKNRTIYTVVTKPVRSCEIVIGRIVGFAAVGTTVLAAMGLLSYVFVVRGLGHDHQINPADVRVADAEGAEAGTLTCETSPAAHHRHTVTIDDETGKGRTDVRMGHWHEVTRTGSGETATYDVGPPQGMLQARVPVFAKALNFVGRTGRDRKAGVNVGKEWTYRSYIEGGTQSRAVWSFNGVTANRYPEGLPLELTLRVFRTHKGEITRGILGRIRLHNPDPQKVVVSAPINFTAREFQTDSILIPRDLQVLDSAGALRDVDLFEDLVFDGKVDLSIECAERGQYFGMAQGDVYLRAASASFELNFLKAYMSIWLQMLLVICFGVMFSAFLTGPVAMLATIASVVLGYCVDFVAGVSQGTIEGGGPAESAWRTFTQMNVSSELDPGVASSLVQLLDAFGMFLVRVMANLLPNFGKMDMVAHVAYGFNISVDLLARNCLSAVVYALVVTVIGYFFLKTREIAA